MISVTGIVCQIVWFMGPTWGPAGSCRPSWAPCWPHEPCYQVSSEDIQTSLPDLRSSFRSPWRLCLTACKSMIMPWYGNLFHTKRSIVWSDQWIPRNRFILFVWGSCWTNSQSDGTLRCHEIHVMSLWFVGGIHHINSSPPSATYMCQWIRSALDQIMACCLFGAKPLSKPMLGYC